MDDNQPQQSDPQVVNLAAQAPPPASRPGQAPPPTPGTPGGIGQDGGVRMLIPVGRCPLAIIAGYLALLSFIPLLGVVLAPAALILAVLAHRRIRRDPKLHGMGRVIFAYIVAALVIAVYLFIAVSMALD